MELGFDSWLVARRCAPLAALAALDVDMAIVGTKIIEYLPASEPSLVAYIDGLRAATPFHQDKQA